MVAAAVASSIGLACFLVCLAVCCALRDSERIARLKSAARSVQSTRAIVYQLDADGNRVPLDADMAGIVPGTGAGAAGGPAAGGRRRRQPTGLARIFKTFKRGKNRPSCATEEQVELQHAAWPAWMGLEG